MDLKLKIALEERKIVQDIINNKEDVRMRTNNWMITVVIGSSLILKIHQIKFYEYFLWSIFVIVIFFCLDCVNRIGFYRMLELSKNIEGKINSLINNQNNGIIKSYDGFKIEEEMGKPCGLLHSIKKVFSYSKSGIDIRFFGPYIAVIMILIFTYFISKK